MQDIHPIGGGGGRFFGGGGDRRLRPNNHLNGQAMKCPRCDSLNTKFCYYNNYNLSQPRHFCKSCRRYWTKGGVLRNVPVGGGCRKSKRSKTKSTPPNPADASEGQKSNSHSSSESSSLTATTTAAAAPPVNTSDAAATEVVSAGAASSNLAPTFLNFSESDFFLPQNTNPTFDHQPLIENSTDVRFQDIGSLTSISMIGFNMGEIPAYRLLENQSSNERQWNQTSKMIETVKNNELKMEETGTGFLNETGRVEFNGLQQSRESNNELPPLDWQTGGGDNGLFDLTGTVDQAYWSQTQWGANDHSLNFLP